jgi:hypothetical protein
MYVGTYIVVSSLARVVSCRVVLSGMLLFLVRRVRVVVVYVDRQYISGTYCTVPPADTTTGPDADADAERP